MKRALASLIAIVLTCSSALADEGMWTFDNFPSANVERNSVPGSTVRGSIEFASRQFDSQAAPPPSYRMKG